MLLLHDLVLRRGYLALYPSVSHFTSYPPVVQVEKKDVRLPD